MVCEMCGCTDERACIEIPSGEPCHWTRPGLCSACDELGGPGPAIRGWPLPDPERAGTTRHEPGCAVKVLHEGDDGEVMAGSHCGCGLYDRLAAEQMAVEDDEGEEYEVG